MRSDRDARIRERAYRIWDAEGRVEGKQDEHWARAEEEIDAEDAASPDAPSAPQTKRAATARASAPVTGEAKPRTISEAREKDEAAAPKQPRRARKAPPA